MDFPYLPPLPGMRPTVCFASSCSLWTAGGAFGAPTSGAWPSANLAIYIPFRLTVPVVVARLWVMNGGSAANNWDVGIYDVAGTRLISTGSTAQSGTNVIQEVDVTDTQIGPGLFYLALAADNTAVTVFRSTPGSIYTRTLGLFNQSSAFALPATATFAASAQSAIPMCGWATRGFA